MAHRAAGQRARRVVLTVALITTVGGGLPACSSDEVVYDDENLARELSLAETLEALPEELPSDSGAARHTGEILRSSYVTASPVTRETSAPNDGGADTRGFISNVSDPRPAWSGR